MACDHSFNWRPSGCTIGAPPSLINLPPGCPFHPRCFLARERCRQENPPLAAVEGSEHKSACHFSEELIGRKSKFSEAVA